MKIIYDSDKDRINQQKHGVSLGEAARIDWGLCLAKPDDRYDYGELRMIGYAPIGQRVYCVVYTDRKTARRIISLRKANITLCQSNLKPGCFLNYRTMKKTPELKPR